MLRGALALLIVASSYQDQSEPSLQQPINTEYAQWALVALALIAALISSVTAYLKLRAAQSDLQRVRAELEKERAKSRIAVVRDAFHLSRCAGAPLCGEMTGIAAASTADELHSCVDAIHRRLRGGLGPPPVPALEWAAEVIPNILDEHSPRCDPETQLGRDIETKCVECYVALAEWLPDPLLDRAVTNCRKWVREPRNGRERLRFEIVRLLLPRLLNIRSTSLELLDTYGDLLRPGEGANIVTAVLSALMHLNIESSARLKLLDRGLTVAGHNWDAFGMSWAYAAGQAVEQNQLNDAHARALLSQISGYITSHGEDLFRRESEYMQLVGLIAKIQRIWDKKRDVRKKNRHIVTEELKGQITFENGHSLEAHLVNFSVPSDGGAPGAWMTSTNTPVDLNTWLPGSVKVTNGLTTQLVANARIRVEHYPPGERFGFRVHFVEMTQDAVDSLRRLASRYPLTR